MLKENELLTLQQQLRPYLSLLRKAAMAIMDGDVSRYPIFVVYQGDDTVGLGLPVVAGSPENEHWSINATTLEELVTKQVVAMEKVDDFRSLCREKEDHACWLVWHDGPAQFVFVPYPDRETPAAVE
jgi:hypothetical protein